MNNIRRFLGAEIDNAGNMIDGKVFSVNYQDLGLEFYSYDPSVIQKAADFLHIEPAPEYVVGVNSGSETSYFEATWRDAVDILQQPKSNFKE